MGVMEKKVEKKVQFEVKGENSGLWTVQCKGCGEEWVYGWMEVLKGRGEKVLRDECLVLKRSPG